MMLDGQNPRHTPVTSQRDAIRALLQDAPEKLLTLATDIAQHGLNPIDNFLVIPNETGLFTVLEGNRRVAALKVLSNPGLADGTPVAKKLRELASRTQPPDEVRVSVAGSRDEARHWLELRHTGERGGAGVVGWSAEAQQRFARRRGTQADRALAFIDAVGQSYPDNETLQSNLDNVRSNRLTTLGRLVSDPYVRQILGLDYEEGELVAHYAPRDLEPAVQRVVTDLADGMTVTDLKTKEQRRAYVENVKEELPDGARYEASARPLHSSADVRPKPRRRKRQPSPKDAQEKTLFKDVTLSNLGSRVSAILAELKKLDVDIYPNAAAVLVRSILELSVYEVYDKKGWHDKGELKTRVRKCLNDIDPTGKKDEYQPVRIGLQDGTSLLAVATMHAYVHNPHYHPTGTELRTIASNYSSFLSALDGLV